MANDTLIAIGEALIDFIPDKTECEFYEVSAFSPTVAGAPTNVCGAFARLGGKSKIITQVGADGFGDKIIRELGGFGIDISAIVQTQKANTALAFVSLGKNGSRTFSFYRKPSADMLFSADMINDSLLDDCYALHFCSVSLGDFPMKATHEKAIDIAQRKGALISFDPNLRFSLWEDKNALHKTVNDFIPKSDILKISDEEIEFITNETDIEKALPKLFIGNVRLVIYTCGKDGAYAFTKKLSVKSDTLRIGAVDTTGAGDGFIGSFLWKLKGFGVQKNQLDELSAQTLRECLDFSNKFCSVSVTKSGAIASYPTIDEMKKEI